MRDAIQSLLGVLAALAAVVFSVGVAFGVPIWVGIKHGLLRGVATFVGIGLLIGLLSFIWDRLYDRSLTRTGAAEYEQRREEDSSLQARAGQIITRGALLTAEEFQGLAADASSAWPYLLDGEIEPGGPADEWHEAYAVARAHGFVPEDINDRVSRSVEVSTTPRSHHSRDLDTPVLVNYAVTGAVLGEIASRYGPSRLASLAGPWRRVIDKEPARTSAESPDAGPLSDFLGDPERMRTTIESMKQWRATQQEVDDAVGAVEDRARVLTAQQIYDLAHAAAAAWPNAAAGEPPTDEEREIFHVDDERMVATGLDSMHVYKRALRAVGEAALDTGMFHVDERPHAVRQASFAVWGAMIATAIEAVEGRQGLPAATPWRTVVG